MEIIALDKKNLRVFVLIAFVGGVIALVSGALLGDRAVNFERRAMRASGVVIDNVANMGGQNQVSYYPKIRFRSSDGLDVTFISSSGKNDAEFQAGEGVTVLYDPQRPTTAVIGSFWSRWGLSVLLIGLGLVALIAAAMVQRSRRSSEGRALMSQVPQADKADLDTILRASVPAGFHKRSTAL
jgi:hypothetical protein